MSDVEQMKEKIRALLVKRGVRKAALFGSHVRGDAGEDSDVDILVELDDSLSLLVFIGLKLELEDSIGKRVDLVEY